MTPGLTLKQLRRLATAVILALFAVILVRTAWVSDDAYITLRTVDNFVHGHGLRWNGDERVQAYTHPLWMLLLSAAVAVTREAYFTTIAAGVLCSIAAVWLCLVRVAITPAQAAIGGLVLAGAKSFVDYSTSGLENPLTHLLLVLLWIASASAWSRARALPFLAASLLLVTRQDLLWLVSPLLIVLLLQSPRPSWRALALALLPIALWESFSLIYYGFLVPNTAYAKLKIGIAEAELIPKGWAYLVDSYTHDPLTLATIGSAIIVSLVGKSWPARAVGLGIVAHLAYLLLVGGDFMSGRFLTAPLLLAVLFLISRPVPASPSPVAVLSAAATMAALSFAPAVPNALSGRDFAYPLLPEIANGIADERGFYFQTTGLIRHEGAFVPPAPVDAVLARSLFQAGQRVITREQIGFFGFAAGPDFHVVDWFGLSDPLMARLPSRRPWRIGHFPRDLPPGYIETLRTGEPRIQDPGLREYFAQLSIITRDPLFSWARLRAIVAMNLGHNEALLAPYWQAHTR